MGFFEKMFLDASTQREYEGRIDDLPAGSGKKASPAGPATLLVPEDLLQKRFKPVRFAEGYEMDEVDDFLDSEVLPSMQAYIDRIAELEAALADANATRDLWATDDSAA